MMVGEGATIKSTPRTWAVLVACAAIVLPGCSASDELDAGPEAPTDGSYAFLAASEGGTQPVTLVIAGQAVTLAEGASTVTAELGERASEAILCPPSGKGKPVRVDAPLTIGGMAFAAPAMFGDCGEVKPVRVTLVDLESHDEAGGPLKFTRWVEFCDTTDPDCTPPAE